jgi:hypothetical protein
VNLPQLNHLLLVTVAYGAWTGTLASLYYLLAQIIDLIR